MWMQWCRLVWGRLSGRKAIEVQAAAVQGAPVAAPPAPQAMRHVGAGNVQVAGSVGGAVRVTHETHMHFYAAPPAPEAANAQRMSSEQRAVLTAMQRLPRHKYNLVLDFMRRELGTAMVNQVQGERELHRLRRYVQTIQRNEERERA